MATTTKRTATYKGKIYTLVFLGDTKYGRRAKLEFLDRSKSFWVDASAVTEGGSGGTYTPKAGRRGRVAEDDRCELCDENKWSCGHCIGW